MLKKNEVYPVTITGYTTEGLGVCRIDGQVVFVHGALEGEQADVLILKVGKNEAYAKIKTLHVASPHRIAPDCPYDKFCGGCALRHMTYEEECRMKSQRVRDAMTRIGGIDPGEVPILAAEETENYRNKAIFPVAMLNGQADAGFYRARTHDLIAAETCKIQSLSAAALRTAAVSWMRKYHIPVYDETKHKGLVRHIYVRNAFGTGQVMACLVVNGKSVPHEQELVQLLRDAEPNLTTVVLCENTRKGNAILGSEFRTLFGPGTVDDTLCGLTFRLSPRSFYQVNRQQAQRLYDLAISRAELQKTDTVLDLYCGTGTITLCMAKACGKAIGVEIIEAAIADAKENAKRNRMENAEFFCGDAGFAAKKLAEDGVRPHVVTVDPPRKGLSPDVIEAIGAMAPRRVVYVSCNPATLARDVARFRDIGYGLRSVDCADLFPRCHHVESVAVLESEVTECSQ